MATASIFGSLTILPAFFAVAYAGRRTDQLFRDSPPRAMVFLGALVGAFGVFIVVGLYMPTVFLLGVFFAIGLALSRAGFAIIPGVALQELWDLMSVAEKALLVISSMVVISGFLGMLTVILSSLEARRREMAVLRSVGARPLHVFALFMSEAGLLTLVGVVTGVILLYAVMLLGQPIAAREFGLHIPIGLPQSGDAILLSAVVVAGFVVGSVPALRAYRLSLADGLSLRV